MTTPSVHGALGWAQGLERLARLIPGIGRYQDREGLRETDKKVRVHLAELLGELSRTIEGAERRLTEANRLDRLPALERVARLLTTLADRIRYASYGFAGVFELQKIRERELAAMHRFDIGLVEKIAGLRGPIQAVADKPTEDADFPTALQAAENALREFECALAERERLARGL